MPTDSKQKEGYEVGFKKALPKNTRFKKGVSGNPSGRPRKKHSSGNR